MIALVRCGKRYEFTPEAFEQFTRSGGLHHEDLVTDTEGRLRHLVEFPALSPFVARPPSGGTSLLPTAVAVAGLGLAIWGACKLIDELTGPESRRYLPKWKRAYVRARDGGVCFYCGKRVARQTTHVDHYKSRANGGSDDLRNLRLACSSCNLSKGAMNGGEFRRLLRALRSERI